MSVTYTKLRDGSWGLRGPATQLKPGAVVIATKRSGETKQEKVGRVLWTGNGVAMATIAGSSSAPSRGGRRGGCRECGGPIVDAARHRAMGGLCGECAFDEYDC